MVNNELSLEDFKGTNIAKGFVESSLSAQMDDFLEKGKALPIGTKKNYNGKPYIKTANGWRPEKKGSKGEGAKEGRDADHTMSELKSDIKRYISDRLVREDKYGDTQKKETRDDILNGELWVYGSSIYDKYSPDQLSFLKEQGLGTFKTTKSSEGVHRIESIELTEKGKRVFNITNLHQEAHEDSKMKIDAYEARKKQDQEERDLKKSSKNFTQGSRIISKWSKIQDQMNDLDEDDPKSEVLDKERGVAQKELSDFLSKVGINKRDIAQFIEETGVAIENGDVDKGEMQDAFQRLLSKKK